MSRMLPRLPFMPLPHEADRPGRPPRRSGAVLLACGLSLLLAACLLSPGRFASTLDIRQDGHFTFTYKGEIYMLALSKMSEMGKAARDKSKDAPFAPSPYRGAGGGLTKIFLTFSTRGL